MQQCSNARRRGCVIPMEEGQEERLIHLYGRQMPAWLRDGPGSGLVARLPGPHALLCAAGAWPSFALVHMPVTTRGGAASLSIDWQAMNMRPEELPFCLDVPGLEESANRGFCPAMALQIADFLRQVCDDDDEQQRAVVAPWVATLQSYYDDVNIFGVAKRIKDVFGKVTSAAATNKRAPFKALFLVQALLYASALRHDGEFKDMLVMGLRLVLPEVIHRAVMAVLSEQAAVQPSKSAFSRWRLVLDTALMLERRDFSSKQMASGPCVRYLMVDSSVQHGRDYLITLSSTIRQDDLPELMCIAAQLRSLWMLGRCHIFVCSCCSCRFLSGV